MNNRLLMTILATILVFATMRANVLAADITLGLISNRTGPTSDIGIDHADGVLDAWASRNERGGLHGQAIEIIEIECGHDIDCTEEAFIYLTEQEAVPLIHGFGTPDSIAVIPLSNETKTVFMPLSNAEELVDVQKAPYMFVTNTDFSTAGRSAVQYVKAQNGKLALSRSPEGFDLAPISAIKDEAAKIGVEIVAEVDMDHVPTDAREQVLEIKKTGATHIWLGNTNTAMGVLAAELVNQNVDARIIGNIHAGDEAFIKQSGDDAEGHLAMYGSVTPSTPEARAITRGDPNQKVSTHYLRGWAQADLAATAIEYALTSAEELTGEQIRKALYSFVPFSPANLLSPVSYSPDNHRPNMVADVYRVENGRWVKHWENSLSR